VRRRLYLRLYFAFLGVLLAIGLISAGIHLATERGRRFPWVRAGPRLANHLARQLPPPGDPVVLAAAVQTLHEELGVDVSVFAADGAVIASAGSPILLKDPGMLARARSAPGWLAHGVVGGPLRGGPGVVMARLVMAGQTFPWRPLLLLCGALLVSLALVYPLSRSITRPIEQLTSAVEAYGKGNLGIRSGLEESQDEVGRLARAFDEMADRIQATRKAEKELLANVSHELRTPLARVRVAMGLIDAPAPAVQRRLDVVAEELDELERLISDVMTASKLDLADLPLRRVHLRVSDLVEKSRQRALAFDQPVSASVEEGLALAGDEALLSRVIDNLLDNARKYADGRPVEISARREAASRGFAVLAVRDRGPGIPPEDLAHVFDPFFRGSAARGRTSGFGLGLALARRVAEAHGGTIRAENAEGGGTRIELRLPAG
jgi:signal transduction histidine kinase